MMDDLDPHDHPIPHVVALLAPLVIVGAVVTIAAIAVAGLWFAVVAL